MSNNKFGPKPDAVADSEPHDLVTATEFGTLFLDSDLRIKRFTEPVTDIFTLAPGDEGKRYELLDSVTGN